jgi:hypothetical protein
MSSEIGAHLFTVALSGELVLFWMEVVSKRSERSQKSLRLPR